MTAFDRLCCCKAGFHICQTTSEKFARGQGRHNASDDECFKECLFPPVETGLVRHPPLVALAAGYIALSFCWVVFSWWNIDFSCGLPAVLTGFDKTFSSTPRFLHVLALGYLFAVVPQLSELTRLRIDHPLAVIGRHSLPVFIFGTILAMVGQVFVFVTDKNAIFGTAFVAAGIGLNFAYGRYLDWLGSVSSGSAPRA
ncbi:hypothetical protein QO002_000214 [Pararhizobium capsulatum DSM 1112]|uniref:Uncharacterized protein n=1 Tax=Pararhizobium capsulatum DSM 1112 TaxID=1121113 RepID=A0ABU0BIJ1_9HYPH|nr:hypothetical protein [Pararhizobium capsulatum DSM 1112]